MTSGSHLIKPPCPFTPYETLLAYKREIAQLYLLTKEGSAQNFLKVIEEQDGVELMTEQQYHELFTEEFMDSASHIVKKLI